MASLASQYIAFRKSSTFAIYEEQPTLLHLIKSVKDQDVLDVGCGIGYYARIMAERGANSVLGIDCSQEMIEAARTCLQEDMTNLRFQTLDIFDMQFDRKYDLVLANFVLCYAENKQKLHEMAKVICKSLVPGGRLIGSVYYADKTIDVAKALGTGRYGIIMNNSEKMEEGQSFSVSVYDHASRPKHAETNYWYNRNTYRAVLRESGFESFELHDFKVNQAGFDRFGPDFWKPLMTEPIFGVIEAKKAKM